MEYFEIYDETGKNLGFTKSRQEAHEKGYWHKIACVFVVNDEGKIILQKRSANKDNNPNCWTASASGHIDAGETEIDGALREMREEIGVIANSNELKYIGRVFENNISSDRKVNHISYIYVLYKNIKLKDLVLQEEEVSDVKYFTFTEAKDTSFAKNHYKIFELLEREKIGTNKPNDVL